MSIELNKIKNGVSTLGAVYGPDGLIMISIDGYIYRVETLCGYNDDCGSATVRLISIDDGTTIEVPSRATINERGYQFSLWEDDEKDTESILEIVIFSEA